MARVDTDTKRFKEDIASLKDDIVQLENSMQDKVKDKVSQAKDRLDNTISDQPMQSVATAFTAGMVAGAFAYAVIRSR